MTSPTVRVSRPEITLRYRAAYQTERPNPPSANPVADLVKAMNRPMDATLIPITASATRAQDGLDLTVSFDLSGLGLVLSQGLWKGKTELAVRFMTAEGVQAGGVLAQTVTFNLRPATYASMLQSGVRYHTQMKIPANSVELKVLVGSLASGKIGTLTIPLSGGAPGAPKQQ